MGDMMYMDWPTGAAVYESDRGYLAVYNGMPGNGRSVPRDRYDEVKAMVAADDARGIIALFDELSR